MNTPLPESMTQTEARARMEALRRWAWCKTEIEPHIKKASNDDSALGFLPNHEFVIKSHAKAQCLRKCRKTAHSWGITLLALSQCATTDRSSVTIGSYDEEEAKNKLHFLDWIYGVLEPSVQRDLKMSDGSEARSFKNGSEIKFVARKAPTGGGGWYLGDEFSVEIKGRVSSTEILTAAIGATTHRGAVRLGGTERGEETTFYKIMSGEWSKMMDENPAMAGLPRTDWEVGEFPWWTSPALCVDPTEAQRVAPIMETIDRVQKFGNAKLKEQFVTYLTTPGLGLPMFQREFEMKVLAENPSYFDLDEILSCCAERDSDYFFAWEEIDGNLYDTEPRVLDVAKDAILNLKREINMGRLRGTFCAALDVGRHRDKDELMIAHDLPEDRESVALRINIGMKQMPFEGKKELFAFMMLHLPINAAYIDGTRGSVGVQLAEWGETKWPGRVQPFQFTNARKSTLSSGIKARTQARKALLPWMPSPTMPSSESDYRDLLTQMLMVKKIETPAGGIVFDVERNEHHHGDKYWSYAMVNDLFKPVTSNQTSGAILIPRKSASSSTRYGEVIHNGNGLGGRRIIV